MFYVCVGVSELCSYYAYHGLFYISLTVRISALAYVNSLKNNVFEKIHRHLITLPSVNSSTEVVQYRPLNATAVM